MKRTAIITACLVTLGLSNIGRASDPITHIADMVAASAQTAEEGAAPAGLYASGTIDVNVFGGALAGVNNIDAVYFGGVGVDWFFWDDVSLVTEIVGYGVQQENNDADNSAGVGFNLLARWHFLKHHDHRLAFFLEGGAGLALFNDNTPGPEGTHFNFTPQAGFGVKWRCADNIGVIAGVRYLHVSNANIHGDDRNPGMDAIGGYGGVTIDF